MGFRDYYRQFDDIDEAKLNLERRERRRQEKQAALAIPPEIDLSGTEWPDLPHSEIVNAAIARASGRVNGYPDRHATAARTLLAERHNLSPDQIALGNGAAELLHSAALALLSPGDELVMPWPSYPALPADGGARRGDARAGRGPGAHRRRQREDRGGGHLQPERPDGTYIGSDDLGALLSALPDHVYVLLDEALIHFQDAEEVDACLRLVEAFPRLLVFRTFSKIYGLSGLRAGYVVCSDARMLAAAAPVLGINALSQAAVEYALRSGDAEVERRRQAVARERKVLTDQLRELGVDVTDSQANFLWIRVRDLSGDQVANGLRQQGVIVAPGGPLGEDHHIRAAVRDEAASNRLLRAIENLL